MIAQGRFNDTVVHRLGSSGGSLLIAANVTGSAVTVRVFNTFNGTPPQSLDQDDALLYDYSIPANDTRCFHVDGSKPIYVRCGTANAVNWTLQ